MEIIKEINGSQLKASIKGKIDTNTSVQLREEVADKLEGINDLIFDFADTAYISSAGMRVLLACQKTMENRGKMVIRNVNPDILKLFKATGMLELLNIENQ